MAWEEEIRCEQCGLVFMRTDTVGWHKRGDTQFGVCTRNAARKTSVTEEHGDLADKSYSASLVSLREACCAFHVPNICILCATAQRYLVVQR